MKKLTLRKVQQLAIDRDGKCLSTSYVNARSPLQWECKEGHQWHAQSESIRRGHWCPTCSGVKKNTLENMKALASSKEGKCLSRLYVNAHVKLEWQCARGHRWWAVPNSVQRGSWCPQCAIARGALKLPNSIEQMKRLAEKYGGKCVSEKYISSHMKLDWECAQGHQWTASPSTIKKRRWCPYCRKAKAKRSPEELRTELEALKLLASTKGGLCLSQEYINAYSRLLWRCHEGHEWWAKPSNIKYGQWCRKCLGLDKKTVGDMQQLAVERGGKFLSPHYINSSTKHKWQCQEKHQWLASPASIIQGHWCPFCAGLAKKTPEEMVALAESRGGKFLSEKYLNQQTRHLWECAEGHQWLATPNSIHNGSWCSECSRSRSERFARLHFERLFNEQFPSCRPKWLTSSRGNRMELDGYCQKLKLAFEYHGMQHFVHKERYHRHPGALAQRQSDDQRKRDLCKANGVYLIEISYEVPIDKLESYIVSECVRVGIDVPPTAQLRPQIEIKDAYVRRILNELQNHAAARGGRCLSTSYKNSLTRLEWECGRGHRWLAIPQSIRRGHWCPTCVRKDKKTIRYMRELAARHGGRCLSPKYLNAQTPLFWECQKGHQWWAVYSPIQKGAWCKKCAGLEKRTIEEMKELARVRGGECLSSEYINIDTPLHWRCEKGHEWHASPYNVRKRNATWCPVCSGNVKKSIEEMQEMARWKWGFCRSTEYRNARTKLVWECARGHQWFATPDTIQRGSWCKKCPRLTIAAMQRMAQKRGGYCISPDYLGRYSKHEWKCSVGHVFLATPNAIRQGGWCNECKNRSVDDCKQSKAHRSSKTSANF